MCFITAALKQEKCNLDEIVKRSRFSLITAKGSDTRFYLYKIGLINILCSYIPGCKFIKYPILAQSIVFSTQSTQDL